MIDVDYITGNKKSKKGADLLKLGVVESNPNKFKGLAKKPAKIKGGTYYLEQDKNGYYVAFTNWDKGREGHWNKKFKTLPEAQRYYSKLK